MTEGLYYEPAPDSDLHCTWCDTGLHGQNGQEGMILDGRKFCSPECAVEWRERYAEPR